MTSIIGHLDCISGLIVSGWAVDVKSPLKSLEIEIWIDNVLVGNVQDFSARYDLIDAGISTGKCAFNYALPIEYADRRTHMLSVNASNRSGARVLEGCPFKFKISRSDLIEGAVSINKDGHIHGWARSQLNSNAVYIVIEVDGSVVAKVKSNNFRTGLDASRIKSAKIGFEWVLPSSYCVNDRLVIRAYEECTQKDLNGSPINFDAKNSYGRYLLTEASDDDARRHVCTAFTKRSSSIISILMPVYESNLRFLDIAIQSVRKQSYPNWELCIADDGSSDSRVRRLIEKHVKDDRRIKYVYRKKNGHISRASNSALSLVTGDYTILFDHDDVLHVDALLYVVHALLIHPNAVMLFSDEDKCDAIGNRYGPYIKPDWDAELMLTQNAFSHLGVFRTDAIRSAGGFRIGYEGSQDYDLALRVGRDLHESEIIHIPKILYHWRASEGSTALANDQKSYASTAMRKAAREQLRFLNESGTLLKAYNGVFLRFKPLTPRSRLTATIILTINELDLSIIQLLHTASLQNFFKVDLRIAISYKTYFDRALLTKIKEKLNATIFFIDDYKDRFDAFLLLTHRLRTDILCWISNDITSCEHDAQWLIELVAQASRIRVGVVNARILDSFGRDTYQSDRIFSRGFSWENLELFPSSSEKRITSFCDVPILGRSVDATLSDVFAMRVSVLKKIRSTFLKLREEHDFSKSLLSASKYHGYQNIFTPYSVFMRSK